MLRTIEKVILSTTKASSIQEAQLIQQLWGGYGELSRVFLNGTHFDNSIPESIILKNIQFPDSPKHPKGMSISASHTRKVKSYQVEMFWYKQNSYQNLNSYIPKCYASGSIDSQQYIILEDLINLHYKTLSEIDSNQINQCLKWLAHFHAYYILEEPVNLWNVGTYWNLETRPDEYELMQDNELKAIAQKIDDKLNRAYYQTFVHGDAKLANFLFSPSQVAAVDFQYVGGGVGIKDVAYFLSSIYNDQQLFKNDKACLDYYFTQLKNALKTHHKEVNFNKLEAEWRELYPYAWADFYRFLQGWSPEHYKVNSYTKKMRDKVVNDLK